MGLPVGEIHLACNANATLPDYFDGDAYSPRPAIPTLANAMDVGAPSNFERLHWTFPRDYELRMQLHAASVDDDTIRDTIVRHARDHGELFCPHTATAVHLLDAMGSTGLPWAVVATAHPAKFDSVVEPLIGRTVDVPPALEAMLRRPAYAEPLAASDAVLKDWLVRRVERGQAVPS
jgi:threonine synthase